MCGGKAGTSRGGQGKASFVKDGEGELIRSGPMIITAERGKGRVLCLPTPRPSSPALQSLWTGTVWGAKSGATSMLAFGYVNKSWEQFVMIPGVSASPVPFWNTDALAGQQRTCPDWVTTKVSSSQTYSK